MADRICFHGGEMNGRNIFGPFRCRLSRKPWIRRAEVVFYRCEECGRLYHEFIPEKPFARERVVPGERRPPSCCGRGMDRIIPAMRSPHLSYGIFGGFNANGIRADWEGETPEWILLQTYTGAILKQLPPGKKPPVVFPLGDEDAYVYCDRPVCEKCLYCCKKGCKLFFGFANGSIIELPLDEIDEYFKTQHN